MNQMNSKFLQMMSYVNFRNRNIDGSASQSERIFMLILWCFTLLFIWSALYEIIKSN